MAHTAAWLLAIGLAYALAICCAPAQSANIHTVVPVECTHGYFEWQVIGLAYSFKRAGQPGPLTRLMSCSEEQLKDYQWLDLMPTYVAPNLAHDEVHDDWYQPYNKPTAIDHWLRDMDPQEEYIMVIDADSILRMPFYPERYNITRGWAYTPYYMEIMEGVNNALALKHLPDVSPRQDYFAGPEGRRADRVGPPYLMHREDMRVVAPLWYNFTYAVRNDPAAWNLTGDTSIKEYGGKTWISEMYGYSFAAARAGVWHRQIDYAANLVPGNGPIGPPMVLHYGNDLEVNNTSYNFSKIRVREADFVATKCPPWDLTPAPSKEVASGGLLPYPPSPLNLPSQGLDLLRDLLSVEPAIILNAAFCEHHKKHCSPSKQLEEECAKVEQQERELDQAYDALEKELRATECKDGWRECEAWKGGGMCYKNPRFMHFGCRKACGTCFKPDLQVRWHRPQQAANFSTLDCAALRAQKEAQVNYDLDYDHSLFGEIPDPCSGESTEAAAAPTAPVIEGGEAVTSQTASQQDGATAQSGKNHWKSNGVSSGAGGGNAGAGIAIAGGLSSAKARVAEAMAARAALAGGKAEAQQLQAGSHVRGGNPDGSNVDGTGGDPMMGHALEGGGLSGNGDPEGDEVEKLPLSQRMRVSIRRAAGAERHERSAASIKALVQVLDWVGVVSIWCCVVAMFLMFLRRPWGRPVLATQKSISRPLLH